MFPSAGEARGAPELSQLPGSFRAGVRRRGQTQGREKRPSSHGTQQFTRLCARPPPGRAMGPPAGGIAVGPGEGGCARRCRGGGW